MDNLTVAEMSEEFASKVAKQISYNFDGMSNEDLDCVESIISEVFNKWITEQLNGKTKFIVRDPIACITILHPKDTSMPERMKIEFKSGTVIIFPKDYHIRYKFEYTEQKQPEFKGHRKASTL